MILVLSLLACAGGEEAPPTPAPTPPPPAEPAAPEKVTVWTADNIDQLVPVMPSRVTTIPRPVASMPKYDTALSTLGQVIETYAGDPDNPWAVAHGVLARGPDLRLRDGRPALAQVFATYAEPRQIGTHALLGFPQELGKIRVEPHSDLLLKNMGEVGLDPNTEFDTPMGKKTAADLYRYTLLKTYLIPKGNKSSYQGPNDIPWGLQALAQWAPGPELQWIATDGTPMDLDFLTSFTAAVITQESAFLFEDMQRGQSFERQGQALFSYTCGGAHLLQGLSYAVARGYGTPKDRKAVEAQVPLWFYRLPNELRIYDAATERNPKAKTRLLVQRMKFLGHFLESMSKMEAMGLFVPDDSQQAELEGAAQNLVLTVEALDKLGVFDHLEKIREQDEQLYLDVVGDSCHAVRGLELALGRGKVRW